MTYVMMLVLFYTLFSCMVIDHQDLHSFPTRRSSDLRFGRRSLPADTCSLLLLSSPGPVWSPVDRKSTRLNSSHVAISYAVFCLKKKKIITVLQSAGLHKLAPRHTATKANLQGNSQSA